MEAAVGAGAIEAAEPVVGVGTGNALAGLSKLKLSSAFAFVLVFRRFVGGPDNSSSS
jgi:hypothetical protein